MQLWNDFLTWFNSPDGTSVLVNGIVPFLAIVVAGFIAAAIGRGSTKRLIALNDRENRVAAIATMIGAARKASVWNTLSVPEQQHAEHVASEADVRVRLLGVTGSGLAADWAAHEFSSMKRNSVSFSFQAEQSLIEFRDRMVTWQSKPGRARKLFKNDLDVWAYEDSQTANNVVSQQQAWAKAQVATQQDSAPVSEVPVVAVPIVSAPTTAPAVSAPAAAPAGAGAGAPPIAPAAAPVSLDALIEGPTPGVSTPTRAPEAAFVPTPAFGLVRRSADSRANDDLATQSAPVIVRALPETTDTSVAPVTPSWISPVRKETEHAPSSRDAAITSTSTSGDVTSTTGHGSQPTLVEPPVVRASVPIPRVGGNLSSATPSFLDTVDDQGDTSDRLDSQANTNFAPVASGDVKNRLSPQLRDDDGRA